MNYQIGSKVFCDFTPEFTCQSFDSRTICQTLTLLDCFGPCDRLVVNNGLLLCDCEDSWNCRLCSNDLPFWNTVNAGDQIFFQFQQPDQANGIDPDDPGVFGWGDQARYKVFRCCDDVEIVLPLSEVPNYYVGLYEQKNYKGESSFFNIQQIQFDVNAIINAGFNGDFGSDNCFYFKFEFATNKTRTEFEEFCSEPFKLNSCLQSTILTEGIYSNKDCFGYFYGAPVWSVGDPFFYSNQYRVKGVLELQNFEIEKEVVTRQLLATNSQQCENYTLNTYNIPKEVAKILSGIFAAREVYLDSIVYQVEGSVDKNNEIGSQWYLSTKFKRCECYQDFSCL